MKLLALLVAALSQFSVEHRDEIPHSAHTGDPGDEEPESNSTKESFEIVVTFGTVQFLWS